LAKSISLLIMCLAIFQLASCDVLDRGISLEDRERENAILDENLDLKEKVTNLEQRIAELQKTQETISIIDQDVNRFFLAVQTGNVDSLSHFVSNSVHVQKTGISFEKGGEIEFSRGLTNGKVSYVRLIGHELNENKGKLTYEFYSGSPDSKVEKVAVEVVQQPEGWKINRCAVEL
jgi:hypothetical protein